MGIYTEKKEQLIGKIKVLETRIASDTSKKKAAKEKLKEVSRLAMAEEYNCKPRELDEIISSEHTLLQKLRASGLSDADLLELVGEKMLTTIIRLITKMKTMKFRYMTERTVTNIKRTIYP